MTARTWGRLRAAGSLALWFGTGLIGAWGFSRDLGPARPRELGLQGEKSSRSLRLDDITDVEGKAVAFPLPNQVLINFWATWCAPCMEEIPVLEELQIRFGRDILVLGLSLDKGGLPLLQTFLKRKPINYFVGLSTQQIEEAVGGVFALPTSVVIDARGTALKKHVGVLTAREAEELVRVRPSLQSDLRKGG